jgi:hypothetical protein
MKRSFYDLSHDEISEIFGKINNLEDRLSFNQISNKIRQDLSYTNTEIISVKMPMTRNIEEETFVDNIFLIENGIITIRSKFGQILVKFPKINKYLYDKKLYKIYKFSFYGLSWILVTPYSVIYKNKKGDFLKIENDGEIIKYIDDHFIKTTNSLYYFNLSGNQFKEHKLEIIFFIEKLYIFGYDNESFKFLFYIDDDKFIPIAMRTSLFEMCSLFSEKYNKYKNFLEKLFDYGFAELNYDKFEKMIKTEN